jgi:hypothetical protein
MSRWRTTGGLLLLAVVIGLIVRGQLATLTLLGDALSPTADPWTEADTIRAAEGYARLGFLANWGLPDLCFGDRFAEQGTEAMLRRGEAPQSWLVAAGAGRSRGDLVSAERFVYTHYPPGPHLVAGLMATAVGPGRVGLYRLVPVATGLAGIVYLLIELALSFGTWRAALAAAALSALPMFTNMMHGLSYQGYSLALLLMQLGLCVRVARTGTARRRMVMAMFLVAFCQGAMGFDYVFLVTLAPVVVALVVSERAVTRALIRSSVTCAAGFTAAHALHFLQVVGYLGGVGPALADFRAIAAYRSIGSQYDDGTMIPSRLEIWWEYATEYSALPLHFGVPLVVPIAVTLALLLAMKAFRPGRVPTATVLAIPAALIVSSLWVVVMHQYSAQHWHFIPRHYFLAAFIPLLALLRLGTPALARPQIPHDSISPVRMR